MLNLYFANATSLKISIDQYFVQFLNSFLHNLWIHQLNLNLNKLTISF